MRQHSRSIKIDQNEFAATTNANDATALYLAIEGGPSSGWNEFRQKDFGRENSAAHDDVAQRANDVLNFGEFRHGCEFDLPEGLQSSP
jgi:hypothetical protein